MDKEAAVKKVCIVTGGASGIGARIVKMFAENDYSVVIADINLDAGERIQRDLQEQENDCVFVKCDVADVQQCDNLIKSSVEQFGRLDIVVNCAGMAITKATDKITLEEWRRIIDTNMQGTFFVSAFAIPYLKISKGCIINIASVAGLVGFRGLSAYCASKGGIIAFSKSLALELAHFGVRVNCICPGVVDTPFMEIIVAQSKNKEAARAHFQKKTPVGRQAKPDEIASVAIFLADDIKAAYMTGAVITVDGGYTAQ